MEDKNKAKRVPKLRFKGFYDEWEQRKLGNIFTFINGKGHEKEVKISKTHNYELVTLGSINENGAFISSKKYIDKASKTLSKNDLVMILSEQNDGLVGITSLVPKNNFYVLNQRVALLKPKNEKIDNAFYSNLINQNQHYFEVRSAGTKVQNISKGEVLKFESRIPASSEIHKISSILKTINCLIVLQQRKLKEIQSLYYNFLNQLINFSDSNVLVSLKNVIHIQKRSINPQEYKNKKFIEFSMPAFDNFQTPKYKTGQEMKSSKLLIQKPVILFNKLNVRKKRIWNLRSVKSNFVSSTEFIPIECTSQIDQSYLYFVLNTEYITSKVKSLSTGSSNSQKRIRPNDLLLLKIPLPDISKQRKIASLLIKLNFNIQMLKQNIRKLNNIKRFLLQNMFI